MKKFLSVIVSMVLIAALSGINVYSKTLPERNSTAVDKVWQVSFSVPIDSKTLTPENIFVKEKAAGNIIKAKLSLDKDCRVVYIKLEQNFKKNTEYVLIISKNIRTLYGGSLDGDYFIDLKAEVNHTIYIAVTDSDGDGLSDYREVHKYFSNPYKKDTDEDGIPDNDMKERTENTYTIKTTMRIKKPYNLSTMSDDYQDVMLKEETSDYGVFDIVLYPYNTNNVQSNYNWKEYAHDPALQKYLKPTITANWDEELRAKIIADLKTIEVDIENSTSKGIKVADDKIVELVAKYLINNIKYINQFTTYYVSFPDGVPTIEPGLQPAFQRDKGDKNWTTQQQFDNELFGRQMYMNKVRGSCTSSAILWETVFRAIGIPSRVVLTIPIVDSNDTNQKAMLSNITDSKIADMVKQGVEKTVGFAAHTYNEVYVGNRWVRLNYDILNQNIVDSKYCGAMIHINTFNDLSEADLVIWGRRYALRTPDSFKYYNPYETLSIKSENGACSKIVVNQ